MGILAGLLFGDNCVGGGILEVLEAPVDVDWYFYRTNTKTLVSICKDQLVFCFKFKHKPFVKGREVVLNFLFDFVLLVVGEHFFHFEFELQAAIKGLITGALRGPEGF